MSDTTNGPGDDPNRTPDEATSHLASVYLDGDVTDDERERVESSPELLAEVESLRQVRAVLGATTGPPPISVREAHLAAALDVWDRMSEAEGVSGVTSDGGTRPAAAALITPAVSGRARRDRRSGTTTSRWLLGAAAGFVVLAGAGLAISGLTRSDDSSELLADTAAEDAAEEPVSEAEIVAAEVGAAVEGEETVKLPEVPEDAAFEEDLRPTATDGTGAASDEQGAADTAQDDMIEEESAVQSVEADDSTGAGEAEPFPPEIDLDRLETIEQLEDFAATAAYAAVDAAAPDVDIDQPYETCDDELASSLTVEQYVGPALYMEEQVVVAIDDDDPPSVIAYRPTDCAIVEQSRLPTRDEYEATRGQP